MTSLAARFDSAFLRTYARSKLAIDPVYAAVAQKLRGHAHPVVDVGCGIGLMSFYLRASGFTQAITGIDHDSAKVASANRATADGLRFMTGDARAPLPGGCSVLLVDVLHYFTAEEQTRILANAAAAVPSGGVVIIRDTIDDHSWRFRATYAAEVFARGVRWIRAERLHFPTRAAIADAFANFEAEVTPLWGATPFNNYLFVFKKLTADR